MASSLFKKINLLAQVHEWASKRMIVIKQLLRGETLASRTIFAGLQENNGTQHTKYAESR